MPQQTFVESLSNVALIVFSGGQEQNFADGRTDGRTDGQTDGRTDRRTQGNPIVPNGETGRGLISSRPNGFRQEGFV